MGIYTNRRREDDLPEPSARSGCIDCTFRLQRPHIPAASTARSGCIDRTIQPRPEDPCSPFRIPWRQAEKTSGRFPPYAETFY